MEAIKATIINGKAVAARVRAEVKRDARRFVDDVGRPPGLCTLLVGDDPASAVYVGGKERACAQVGFRSFHQHLPAAVTEDALLAIVAEACANDEIDGVLVQLPLPAHIDPDRVIMAIDPMKDVDGFHPLNVGSLVAGRRALAQCTPLGIVTLLDEYEIELAGAEAVIVNRSQIVGKPLAFMLLRRNATVTIAHRHTRDLGAITRRADVLITATGVAGLIHADMVKPGAAVVDVGISRTADGLRGDVRFDEVAAVASAITPVPGGVGPMTITMLVRNTMDAAWWRARGYPPQAHEAWLSEPDD